VKEMGSRFKVVHGKPQIVIAKKKKIKMGDGCEKYGFKVVHAEGSDYNNKKRKIKILTTVYKCCNELGKNEKSLVESANVMLVHKVVLKHLPQYHHLHNPFYQ
jgi:hypothetical protein